jgi:hypothetical protein
VLLATDAGGEGLNLHNRCRLVINLELPWNPMRLEQRIGRVDRLGQLRRVHAINFFACRTTEESVLRRLFTRLARARQALGLVNDPLGHVDDVTTVMLENDNAAREDTPQAVLQPDLHDDAMKEVARLQVLRRAGAVIGTDRETVPLTVFRRSRVLGLVRSPSLVCLLLARLLDGDGELVEGVLVPVVAPFTQSAPIGYAIRRPAALRKLVESALEAVGAQLEKHAMTIAERRLRTIAGRYEASVETRRARALMLIRTIELNRPTTALVQPGLFDTRVLRDHATTLQTHLASLDDEVVRLRQIDRARELVVSDRAEVAAAFVVA